MKLYWRRYRRGLVTHVLETEEGRPTAAVGQNFDEDVYNAYVVVHDNLSGSRFKLLRDAKLWVEIVVKAEMSRGEEIEFVPLKTP